MVASSPVIEEPFVLSHPTKESINLAALAHVMLSTTTSAKWIACQQIEWHTVRIE
jgi:hypothetical protein